MNDLIKLPNVNDKIICIRNQNVILDSDVAELYGVETKRINEAVKNNPEKFPEGYILSVQSIERQELVENFDRFNNLKHSISTKAFTERGLYMLATILKSPQATQTTIAIIEAFTKMREVSHAVAELMQDHENIEKQQILMEKSGEFVEMIVGDTLDKVDTETSYELNLAAFKIKHTVKRSRNNKK
ncbi:MAG: ORF6N domain-containing protein [Bacteroidales bacterium]|jgi:phage regulator Rha-like protein|nr:ORF6N domain-containing protein [Bacteroidales bacterium]